jgi:hypothetical protein
MRDAKIGNIPVKVVSQDEAEQAAYVVCGSVSHFRDDVWTTCGWCQARICHRPQVPVIPPKICLRCVATVIQPGLSH